MKLYYISQLLDRLPEFEHLLASLHARRPKRVRLSLPDQAIPLVVATLYSKLEKTVLFVAAHAEAARSRFEQIKLWLPESEVPLFFPEAPLLDSSPAADPFISSERSKVIARLTGFNGVAASGHPVSFIMCCAAALIHRSEKPERYKSECIRIKNGMSIRQSMLLERLQSIGYTYEDVVELPGTFTKKGGIVDVYPCGQDAPARIEFFGNEINSLRLYDARSQRSIVGVQSLFIPPAGEQSGTGTANILDYLPVDAILLLDDIRQIESEVERLRAEFINPDQSGVDDIGRAAGIFDWETIEKKIAGKDRIVEFSPWDDMEKLGEQQYRLPLKGVPDFSAKFSVFFDKLPELRQQSSRILIVSQQAERIRELLQEHDVSVDVSLELKALPADKSIVLLQGCLDGGWQLDNELILLTDADLFGNIKRRRFTKNRPVRHHLFLNDINVGDLVVHVEHGIGKFAGIVRKVSAGVEREYLKLEYACGDILYVPVDQIDRVSLYIGGTERAPSLSRLGSQDWVRTQQRVKQSVANIAGELIELYAGRAAGGGIAFSKDTLWQKELEASFPYIETPDQLEAIQAVKADMESARPMDRLVCGDVGYGKTEIALRAAFKAVMDGKQVAVLVPTTILAQQHMGTFSERLKPFPVKVAVLSRFCSAGEQTAVVRGLAEGSIDICIGTHRLLQKDVQFKDLGLVIIDEEQRFGVVHKEHFKKMRQSVDVLTLSATPIPRTMHMALSGIRDMSTIETPPENRLPVITYVGEYNDRLVREALLRELERDGQAFLVHNRVQSIGELALKVERLIPGVRFAVAHGRMDEDKLEDIMSDFMRGKSDVLVTTTIIESGLDLPNVNTLIVNDADKMGLTQLYQLRGRIGRGANTAYAYFLFGSGKSLTDQAIERLKVIARATELGAGYAVAMKDLEIRGAGNLLGVEQSGNIAAVGFSYYCRLLEEAVEESKARREGRTLSEKVESASVTIDLKIPSFIPDHYIENTRTRFNFYRRMAGTVGVAEVSDIAKEMIDRFGDLPEEVTNLLYAVELRQSAIAAEIESIVREGDVITVSLADRYITNANGISILKNRAVRLGNRQIKIDAGLAEPSWMVLLKELVIQLGNVAKVAKVA